ncbi:hypothetical protein QE152_g10371 [Popillia japonica]|uniref:Uncharacterized protein n=1 Tax=Popillia japonica TaxID=7064 RepID=A0AAW1LV05_POPJA
MYAKDKAHYNIHEKFVEIQNTVPQVRTADEIRDLCLSQTGVDIAKLLLEKHKISDVSSENKYEFEIEDFFDFLQENYVTRFLLNNEISAGSKTSDDNSDEELQ